MLGNRNIRNNVGYVTIGLFANTLLDELFQAASDPGVAPKQKSMINLAIASLKEFETSGSVDRSEFKMLIFRNYQEACALRETLTSSNTEVSNLLKALENIIVEVDIDTRRKNLSQAINFFYKLGRSAIIDAERPKVRGLSGATQFAISENPI
jgi:hypothetical protein